MTPSSTTFILDDFSVPSPAQQLLDRFLIGYNKDGEVHGPTGPVHAHFLKPVSNTAIDARVKNFGLRLQPSLKESLANAAAVIIALRREATPNPDLYAEVITALPPASHCFIYGGAAYDVKTAEHLFNLAADHHVVLDAGTEAAHLFPLPELKLPIRGQYRRGLIVVQGTFPHAEAEALEALFTAFDPSVSAQIAESVRALGGENLWRSAYSAPWRPLLAAAISRSNTIHGDPDKDGRPQDIVGLHLLEKLTPNPRGWLIEHPNNLSICVLVLDGAFSDINFAVELTNGPVASAQLLRSQSPMQEHFSNMAVSLVDFFRGAKPASSRRPIAIAAALEKMNLSSRAASAAVRG
ncbi:MAG TPA: hypothetical protein VGR78_18415 [Verrucomicrobiae bacterium]|jgi:hypothetical protein|nr:hypothetical protein [Verrucomicrobiae bacterium]